jgi:Ca2+-binding RTX toxin-like protein
MRTLRLIVAAACVSATFLTPMTASYAAPPSGQRSEITGTSGDDDIKGTNGPDVIRGLAGDDHIDGRKGHDVLIGGAGNDTITDYLGIAGQKDDKAVDTFRGGPGDDTLFVGHGDTVWGGSGNDTINGFYLGEGDLIHCGLGKDVLIVNEDLHGVQTDACEKILVKYAG